MPFADNGGVRIYYETEGQGPPLVMQHALAGSLEEWRDNGFVAALSDAYRLILVDARGHGRSDKPHDEAAYDWSLRSGDVLAVLDAEGVERAHFLGYSTGAWTGFALGAQSPERFRSIILGGMVPHDPFEGRERSPLAGLFRMPMMMVIRVWKQLYGEYWSPQVEARLRANDLRALRACVSNTDSFDFADVLARFALPCLFYGGEQDPNFEGIADNAPRLPAASYVIFREVDHVGAYYRADLVVPHVRRFLESHP